MSCVCQPRAERLAAAASCRAAAAGRTGFLRPCSAWAGKGTCKPFEGTCKPFEVMHKPFGVMYKPFGLQGQSPARCLAWHWCIFPGACRLQALRAEKIGAGGSKPIPGVGLGVLCSHLAVERAGAASPVCASRKSSGPGAVCPCRDSRREMSALHLRFSPCVLFPRCCGFCPTGLGTGLPALCSSATGAGEMGSLLCKQLLERKPRSFDVGCYQRLLLPRVFLPRRP